MDKIELKIPPLPFETYQYLNKKAIQKLNKNKILLLRYLFFYLIQALFVIYLFVFIGYDYVKKWLPFYPSTMFYMAMLYIFCMIFFRLGAKYTLKNAYNSNPILKNGQTIILADDFVTIKREYVDIYIKANCPKKTVNWKNKIYFIFTNTEIFLWIPKELIENHPEKDQIYRQLHITP